MDELVELAASEDAECVLRAVDRVFRRLLADLLLHATSSSSPQQEERAVRYDNAALQRHTAGVSHAFVVRLFALLGYRADVARAAYVYDAGDDVDAEARLRRADAALSQLEEALRKRQGHGGDHNDGIDVTALRALAQRRRDARATLATSHASSDTQQQQQPAPCADDEVHDEALVERVRHTLLHTGRLRNSVFDARDMRVRRMTHGRHFACSERCGDDCLEVHWHAYSSRNLMYACLAHVSPDGATVLHLGYEHGYQYNSIPGTRHFRRTVHFSEKHTTVDGALLRNVHHDKPVDACIYCNTPFSVLWA